MGPNGEDVPPRAEYTCGEEWYYAFEPGDELLISVNPALDGLDHPFVSADNKYCLDCGMAIQVCASVVDATCEDLGLPPKGSEAAVPATTPAPVETAPATTPAPVATEPVRTPAPVETEPATTPAPVATEPATTLAPVATESATPPAPVATEQEETMPAPVATEPEDTTPAPVATEPRDVGEVDGVQARSAASLSSYSLVVVCVIAGWTLSVFI